MQMTYQEKQMFNAYWIIKKGCRDHGSNCNGCPLKSISNEYDCVVSESRTPMDWQLPVETVIDDMCDELRKCKNKGQTYYECDLADLLELLEWVADNLTRMEDDD